MEQTVHEFFHGFRQELMADAESGGEFQLESFLNRMATELIETGYMDGYDICHYYDKDRGIRVDGYCWDASEETLHLIVADYNNRDVLESLTKTETDAAFRRLTAFFTQSLNRNLYLNLEETSPVYGLSKLISDIQEKIRKASFYLISERILSERLQTISNSYVSGIEITHSIWDISRLHRQMSSRGLKEPIEIDFIETYRTGIPCLRAHLSEDTYPSYLAVIPGEILADLYGRFGARLLEQNVRSFLQARSKVNKGIQSTILNEAKLFFAYNNGITATAQEISTASNENGLTITSIRDLQIVNGGQTTASLFHTRRRYKAPLDQVFVQIKLSVIDGDAAETVVPKISEYANTQNKVNAADFFANSPFHIRMESFSRRIWAPAHDGAVRETKWFYERARGQYADAQSKLTAAEQRRFAAEYPKAQMFTKTDLAKFENVWDDHPKYVNLGAQKNFARYALRIGAEWAKSDTRFNESYFRRAVARAIVFRHTEAMVSRQPWYDGGYRANIVAYTIAMLNEYCKQTGKQFNFQVIWESQTVPEILHNALVPISKIVHTEMAAYHPNVSNISEWCKRETCWEDMKLRLHEVAAYIPREFSTFLMSKGEQREEDQAARREQRMENEINAQIRICRAAPEEWTVLRQAAERAGILTDADLRALRAAENMERMTPTERQCTVLLGLVERARTEGIPVPEV